MIGPLTEAVLWLGGFWIEIALWCLLGGLLYAWLSKYLITRYLIAYPGLLLVSNIAAWIIICCVWFFVIICHTFYVSFFTDFPHEEMTDTYYEYLSYVLLFSTFVVSAFCAKFIYEQERDYWKNKKQSNGKK